MNNLNTTSEVNNSGIKKVGGDNLFDINRLIRLVLKNWYLFVISFPLCLGAVFIYHRYTVPVYKASATLLLKSSEQKTVTPSGLMEGFGLSPEMRSIENQSFIIRSRNIVKKAIDGLDFGVSYYQKGRFKDSELYRTAPFVVEFDSLHAQLLNVPIQVVYTSTGKAQVTVSCEAGALYNYINEAFVGRIGTLNYNKVVADNEWVTTNAFSFKLHRNEHINVPQGASYYFIFKSHQQLTSEYRNGLGVSPYSEGSSILFISSIGANRAKLVRFLDELCEVILEHNLDRKNDMASRSIVFIESQLKTVADTLEKVQDRLSSYRKANRFMGPSEFSQKLADKYYETESELKMLRMRIDYYRYLQENLMMSDDIEQFLLPAVDNENNSLVNELASQLIELQKEMELLQNDVSDNNQYLTAQKSRMEVTVDLLNKAIKQVLRNFRIEEEKIQNELTAILADMEKLPDLEKDYLIIDRTYKLNDAIYTFLLQKHSETQITKASNSPDNEIIDNASITALVSPNKNSDYKKGLMLALLIPAVFIGLKEFLNTKVRGKEDLNHLVPGVPIVGMVMHNKNGVENVIDAHPHSIISESFRSLRTKLKFMAGSDKVQVITLTSSNTGEGKTFCAQNLASVFAISGKKTVIVGFDMRKPRLTALYDLHNKLGLSNYFIGQTIIPEIIYPTDNENVSVIPAGPIPPNPSELIVGDKTEELYRYLRNEFDVIVIDSPPIGLVADARLLMDYSDCNLFIVRSNYSSKEHMVHTIDSLINEKVEGLGIILNDISAKEKGYGYYSAEYYGDKG
ncbi:polysaccharide biosynthesis tyrosine autokinase [Carboxylicivirga mesophila]|uniref:non-specific protein-tyrosine kinase n=1 Tax=Carboxylicivirga mesophila TaxID=1166478 RepID=A0ABS5KBS2_9BACT|nr:tyrosine-protein kinase [Carboxylicivirga mesophila]MBS2212436.1 polysaccharide biosynthesis tyrosine autokinase [Carboxylicivirga mesophila]